MTVDVATRFTDTHFTCDPELAKAELVIRRMFVFSRAQRHLLGDVPFISLRSKLLLDNMWR